MIKKLAVFLAVAAFGFAQIAPVAAQTAAPAQSAAPWGRLARPLSNAQFSEFADWPENRPPQATQFSRRGYPPAE